MSDCYSVTRDYRIFLSQVANPQIRFRAKSRRKPRGKCVFRQRDLTRAIKAAKAAGMSPTRATINAAGEIVLHLGEVAEVATNDWDELLERDGQ